MTLPEHLGRYPLVAALRERRSRRFGLGMKMDRGPLAFQSRHEAVPLSGDEEAALAFAACGVTGYALGDLTYHREDGGNIMSGILGRTVASGDANQAVVLAVTNDEATYLLKRPADFRPAEIPELVKSAEKGEFAEIYRKSREKVREGRVAPPLDPMFNISVNRWSLYATGTSYFLPINDLSFIYINVLLELFNQTTRALVVDERNGFQPAGLAPFTKFAGGHLEVDPASGRVLTVGRLELMVAEVVAIEQGMMLQNLGLMAQALGLGGFPNFALHEFGWFQALGFRMEQMPAGKYLSGQDVPGLDLPVPYAVGLEPHLRAFCPPNYPSMKEAVKAALETKFTRLRGEAAWRDEGISAAIPDADAVAVDAAIAYCEYIYDRYGRFPATVAPYRTILGFQAAHLDLEFYEKYYRPEALSEPEREHMVRYHPR